MGKLPILFITFTKVEQSARVFHTIKKYQPTKLFLAQDGPREGRDDLLKILEVRKLDGEINWDCEVFLNRLDYNMGVRKRIETAITWFLECVPEGIILEDDTVPSDDFFPFCEELIERYRDDNRVFMIGGTNLNIDPKVKSSYFFTKTPLNWGWATWADRWKLYDPEMERIKSAIADRSLEVYYPDPYQRDYEIFRIKQLELEAIPAWDYRWSYTMMSQHGLCAVPNRNLVYNIGFGHEATNTFDPNHSHASLYLEDLDWPLEHPPYLVQSYVWEEGHFFPGQDKQKYIAFMELIRVSMRKLRQKLGLRN